MVCRAFISWTTSLKTECILFIKNEDFTKYGFSWWHRISHRIKDNPLYCYSKNSVFICHKGRDCFEKNKTKTDKICSMGVNFLRIALGGG